MQLGCTINHRPFVYDLISGFDKANKIKFLVKQSILSSLLVYWISFRDWMVLFFMYDAL